MAKDGKEKMIIFRINEKFRADFKKHCEDNGYVMSKRLIALMKKDMESGK